ncbi:hypothetical protein P2R51_25745, partial [Escherichia coli]
MAAFRESHSQPERNNFLARRERVVGKNGIIVEPHPVLRNGAIARDLAAEIRTRWSEWSVSPEVTGQFTRP